MEETTKHIIADLIFRSLTGEATPHDDDGLKRWLSASSENERHFRQLKDLWTSSEAVGSLTRYDAEKAFEKFSTHVMADGGFSQAGSVRSRDSDIAEPLAPRKKSWLHAPVWIRWAAVILVVAGCCWQFYKHGQLGVEQQLSQVCVEAPVGSQAIATLPDGTRITLNAGSRITYSQGFGIKDRDVALTGEGFFEVAHQGEKPFTVTTADISVRDIGTKFCLADYPDDNEATVVLTDGTVELKNKFCSHSDPVVMKNGQRAVLSKRDGRLLVTDDADESDMAWMTHQLILDGKSIYDIARELGHGYNVKVTVADDRLSMYHFFGCFDTSTQSLQEILTALRGTGKLSYRINGRNVTLY
ncbi:anti-sigma factor [Hallella multisaccharivorax DSM 17128]|uniref:Anti-FecI sigma factor, FecR n=1 Tax=Hallella multisaccharivorax DSM 17128 TaxID=688246 RepID=F8N7F9_9BACT|nr:FecR family protein [Hallella multisaccharivorax]EGN56386.1 anti-FecI sigma factor, FecR [Hallella multisaccharivorax DSM 17128]GJG29905.1 anti-sigma factor [Hallella multisaccharivorax DSM 17128]